MRGTKNGKKKRLIVDLSYPNPSILKKASLTIFAGGTVLHPTDTVYGLGCDPFSEDSIQRILELKKRTTEKGFLLLIPDPEWVPLLSSELPHDYSWLVNRLWPGPITFLLPASKSLPKSITGSQSKIGLRCPALPLLRLWLSQMKRPIVSTSANPSGLSTPHSTKRLDALFGDSVDLFIDAGELPKSLPSTVIDLCSATPQIVRKGAMYDQVCDLLKKHP